MWSTSSGRHRHRPAPLPHFPSPANRRPQDVFAMRGPFRNNLNARRLSCWRCDPQLNNVPRCPVQQASPSLRASGQLSALELNTPKRQKPRNSQHHEDLSAAPLLFQVILLAIFFVLFFLSFSIFSPPLRLRIFSSSASHSCSLNQDKTSCLPSAHARIANRQLQTPVASCHFQRLASTSFPNVSVSVSTLAFCLRCSDECEHYGVSSSRPPPILLIPRRCSLLFSAPHRRQS